MASSSKKRASNAAVTAQSSNGAAARTASRTASSVEFNPDYTYVKKDLTRIGILAGSFILVLVVLSFFLR